MNAGTSKRSSCNAVGWDDIPSVRTSNELLERPGCVVLEKSCKHDTATLKPSKLHRFETVKDNPPCVPGYISRTGMVGRATPQFSTGNVPNMA